MQQLRANLVIFRQETEPPFTAVPQGTAKQLTADALAIHSAGEIFASRHDFSQAAKTVAVFYPVWTVG